MKRHTIFFGVLFAALTVYKTDYALAGETWKDSVTGMEFVFVKGGCYQMGDTFGDGYNDEKPVHEVCVDDFWMGKFEVTEGEWVKIMGKDAAGYKMGDNYPVENVSWNDVRKFIKRLNKKTGKEMFRLPTEAEWEYAARSGGKQERWAGTSENDSLNIYANIGVRVGATTPVGSYKPNGLGLYDMSGNVWEWVQDVYNEDAYRNHFRRNPVFDGDMVTVSEFFGFLWRWVYNKVRNKPTPLSPFAHTGYHVFRGGNWLSEPRSARCAHRHDASPYGRHDHIGFRLLRTP